MSMNKSFRACSKCKRPCEGEAFVALKDGSVFHRFCFTCEICHNELPLKFALKNGQFFHTECYSNAKANAPKCMRCDGPILSTEISVVLGTEMKFHNRCFVCDGCQKPLSDRFYSTAGQFYHEECVSCAICHIKLYGKNFSQLQEGGYICDGCLYNNDLSNGQGQRSAMNGGYGNAVSQNEDAEEEAWVPPQQNGGGYYNNPINNGYGQYLPPRGGIPPPPPPQQPGYSYRPPAPAAGVMPKPPAVRNPQAQPRYGNNPQNQQQNYGYQGGQLPSPRPPNVFPQYASGNRR